MNAYLQRKREEYDGIRASIEGLQTRAAEENRDLTEAERQTLAGQQDRGKALFTEIETLTDIETRNAKVAQMALGLERNTQRERDKGRGGRQDVDRDEVYTRSARHGFFGDMFRAERMGDKTAASRLADHAALVREAEQYRDVLTGSTGAGLIPPVWLADQFAPILHRKLRVASVLRQVPFAGPTAWTIPVAGTGNTVETQAAEGANATESAPTYTTITATPKAISGYADVSRQELEASNPAVDAIIWGDLGGAFYDQAETETITAIVGQASVNAVTIADGSVLPGTRNGVIDAITAVSDNAGGDADVFAGRTSRWGTYKKLSDTTNRPLIQSQSYVAMNNIGEGGLLQGFRSPIQGTLEELLVVTSPTIAANLGLVLNSQELLFSLSTPDQFSYEQTQGPALVRIGLWGYAVIVTGRRPKAITKITYTAN